MRTRHMPRKILAGFLSAAMLLSMLPMAAFAAETETPAVDAPTAAINTASEESGHATLQEAIAEAESGDTITLWSDLTESVTIPAGQEIILDLNGKTLTNEAGKDTITVSLGAKLTVNGDGTVDNVSHQMAALVNNGTVVLNGGSYTRSQEASTSTEDPNGNSYYNILNHGVMTVNEGVSVISTGAFSSLIDNGYYNYASTNPRVGYVEGINQPAPSLTINGGVFSGGINTIKNDDAATAVILDGVFSNVTQAVVYNANKVLISGGAFYANDHYALFNCSYNTEPNVVEAEITDGTFEGSVYSGALAKIAVSGGTYSEPFPESYCAEGFILVEQEDGGYGIASDAYVASVKGSGGSITLYESLQAAIDAAEAEAVVKLLGDVTESITIAKGQSIVLELNGKTLTGEANSHGISNSGTLTVRNGSIVPGSYGSTTKYVLYSYGGATTVEDVTIENAQNYMFYLSNNAQMTIRSGKFTQNAQKSMIYITGTSTLVTIDGGTFTRAADDNVNVMLNRGSGGKYVITGGVFADGSSLILKDGTYYTVTGGRFSSPVYAANCPAGYGPTTEPDGNGYYTVTELAEDTAVVVLTYRDETDQEVTAYYTDPQVALNDANSKNGAVVTIKKDVTTGSLSAYYAKLVVEEGVVLTCTTLMVSSASTAGVTVENNGTIIAESVAGTSGSGTLVNNGTISCGKSFNASTVSADGTGWENNGTIEVGGTATLKAFVNNGTVSGTADAAMTVVEAAASGTGTAYQVGSYRWDEAQNTWVLLDNTALVIRDNAIVGGFSTLAAAYSYAKEGDIVQLQKDVTLTSRFGISKSITLDLNKFTVTDNTTSYGIFISGLTAIAVTIKNGTIIANNSYAGIYINQKASVTAENLTIDTSASGGGSGYEGKTPGVYLKSGNTFTLDADSKILSNEVGIFTLGRSVANVYGTVETISAYGTAGYAAIQGNGTDKTAPGTTINIYPGAVVKSSGFGMGIYHPQVGTLNIYGGTISGNTGIGIKSGNLNITGGTIEGTRTGEYQEPESATNGISSDGSAILVDSYIGYAGSMNIHISGQDTTLRSASGYALREIGNTSGETNVVTLIITEGTLEGASDKAAVLVREETAETVDVSGGNFSSKVPEEYCADGYVPTELDPATGMYTVLHPTIKVYSATLTLDGTIGVNFYVDLSDVEEADRAAYRMHFTVNGTELEAAYDADAYRIFNGKKYYRFTCPVAAKQMTDTITAQVFAENAVSKQYTYSVKKYCDRMINNANSDESLKALLKAMLNYGGYAQEMFGYNTGSLANADLYAEDEDPVNSVTAEQLQDFASVVEGELPAGITRVGATLTLESAAMIRFYIYTEGDIGEYRFSVNGKECTPVQNTGTGADAIYYIEVPDITARQLGKIYTLSISKDSQQYSVTYSALTYAYNMLASTDEEILGNTALQNVVKAMYLYYKAAQEYGGWLEN